VALLDPAEEMPVLWFEMPVLGFEMPVLGFEMPVLEFEMPVLGFEIGFRIINLLFDDPLSSSTDRLVTRSI